MTRAADILSRALIISAMIFCVSVLMRLTGAAPSAANIASARHADPVLAMTENWSGEIDYRASYSALNPYQAVSADVSQSMFDPGDDYWGLPRSEGYETVAGTCAACHTLQIVMQQQLPKERWDYLLTWMVEKQGMAEPPADTRGEILDYLTREFGEDGQ